MARPVALVLFVLLLAPAAGAQEPSGSEALFSALLQAEDHIERGEISAARLVLENARALAPEDARIPFLLAQCEFNAALRRTAADRFEEAKRLLLEADRLDPTYPATPFVFGLIGIESEDYAAAVDGFRQALARGYNPLQTRGNLAYALFLRGTQMSEDESVAEPEPTIAVFEEAERRLAALCRDVRLPAADRERFQGLWVKARVNLAAMHQVAGNFPRAKEILKKLIEDYPDNPYHHYDLGLIYGEGHEWDEAMQKYRDALAASKDPRFLEPLLRMGHICSQRGEQAEAERYFALYLATYPDTWYGNFYLGEHYVRVGRHAEAVQPFLRCIEIESTAFAAIYKLSSVLRRLGRVGEAEKWEALYGVEKAANSKGAAPKRTDRAQK